MLSRYKRELANANSYDEWLDIASAIETANGTAAWKVEEKTRLYDYLEVRNRRDNLQRLRKQRDVKGLVIYDGATDRFGEKDSARAANPACSMRGI